MSKLIELLWRTQATKYEGVEGLVAVLVSDALGLEARIEKSGSQRGRDIGLFDRATSAARHIDIEVKRYQNNRSPDKRELFGEIAETWLARPETELWIVVSTAAIPAAAAEELNRLAFHHGIDVLVLDCAPEGSSVLEVLIASREAVTLDWVSKTQPGQLDEWRGAIAQVQAAPAFAIQAQEVGERLVSRYAARSARERSHHWLAAHVASRRERIRDLNQSLGRAGRAPAIARPRIEAGWREWLECRGTETSMLVLLGGEGDGKTWSAIDALLADGDRTVLVATSNLFDDGGAESLIAQALARQCGGDADRWRSRLGGQGGGWPSEFRMTLLVDGLNEAPHRRTDLLLAELMTGPLNGVLDVIVTCRTPFWQQRIEHYLRPYEERLHVMEVGPFDYYDEWPLARAELGDIGALPDAVTEALRNPRLWSFAYDLKDEIGGMAEVTLERLLVEHWRMRIRERGELKVDPEAFNRLIARSVRPLLRTEGGRPGILQAGDVEAMLRQMAGGNVDLTADLADLRDGVFFEPAAGGGMKLRTKRVPAALGFLLAEQLIAAAEEARPDHAVHRAAALFLDDLPAADTVELVVRSAIFALLAMPGGSPTVVPTLLRHWVSLQNFEHDFYRALAIVAAAAPEAMIRAIEDEASQDQFAGDAAAELTSALRGRRDRANVADTIARAAELWLRSFSSEHLASMENADGRLISSPIDWIETLDDIAANFLSEMPLAGWARPLAFWVLRRAARLRHYGSSYDYTTFLPWLGASGDHAEADIAAVPDQARTALDPPLDAAELDALRALLDGGHLCETGVVQELLDAPWDETLARAEALEAKRSKLDRKLPITFEELYGDGSTNAAEPWLQLEAWLLDHDPALLAKVVLALFAESGKMGKRRMTPGHLLFARQHALLIGEPMIQYVARLGAASNKRISADAMPAVFAVCHPVWHREQLLSVLERWGHRLADLTGYEPFADAAATQALRRQAAKGVKAAALVYCADLARSGLASLAAEDRKVLLQLAAHDDDKVAEPAIELLDISQDLPAAHRFAASGRTVAAVQRSRAARVLSSLIIRGSDGPVYSALRSRIVAGSFPAAATADGSVEACEQLKADFNAILGLTASEDWPVGRSAADLEQLATCGNLGRRRILRSESAHDGLVLSLDETERFLDVIADADPAFLEALLAKPDAVSDGALASAEEKTWLVSALACRAPAEKAAAWMLRFHENHRLRIDHKGLLVTSAQRFAFLDKRAGIAALRDRMAEDAWSDAAMLDLVCLAQIEDCEAWLEAWIQRESESLGRARRMRSLLLRGWRANVEDRRILDAFEPRCGYDRFALDIARARALRLERLRRAMTDYAKEPANAEAWLAHRRLLHAADRRIYVEHARQDWPDALPRARRVMHEMAAGDFERMIRRNEGDLERMFAGAVYPPSMPPWGHIEIYSPQDDWDLAPLPS